MNNDMAICETEEFFAVNDMLRSLLGNDDTVLTWWGSYNKAFNCTPEAMWEKDKQKVKQYVLGFCI